MFAAGVPDVSIDEARKLILLKIVAELPDDFFDPDEHAVECRADLEDAVEFLTIARQSREVTEFLLPGVGYDLLVTGGMSNGDSPTDAYDLFNYIWHCKKLYEQIEEWAKEDYAERAIQTRRQKDDQR
jgi:hypothetical protein